MITDGYLLLVEDEPAVQAKNKKILERCGYTVEQAYTIAEAQLKIAEEMPKAIVLDIQLPDGSGLEFLSDLRETSNVPVLMLTAMGTSEDIIRGISSGGDDYLTKPYDLNIFLARLDALLRRAAIIPASIGVGPIRIDTASKAAFINGLDIGLQPKEFSLLEQFVQHHGKMLSVEFLYEKVWGQKLLGDTGPIKTAMHKLRKKLEGSGYVISSERGEGYCFEEEPR